MTRRAEQQEATRVRIVDAAIDCLHRGPASLTAIAAAAGVGRVTLYRHFADEAALMDAALARLLQTRPLPTDVLDVSTVDRDVRLRAWLDALYGYYEAASGVIEAALELSTAEGEPGSGIATLRGQLTAAEKRIADDWPGAEPGSLLSGAVQHAMAFETWQSLRERQGLSTDDAAALMAGLVRAASAVPSSIEPARSR